MSAQQSIKFEKIKSKVRFNQEQVHLENVSVLKTHIKKRKRNTRVIRKYHSQPSWSKVRVPVVYSAA